VEYKTDNIPETVEDRAKVNINEQYYYINAEFAEFEHIVGHGYNCSISVLEILQETRETSPNVQISDYFYHLISLCAQ